MEFRILGPLEVAVEGTPVVLGPAKQRALLGILLLHANEVVPRERLVDELWGERPPPTATKIVQVYVSQLRRALDAHGGGDVLRTRAPGYVAAVEDEQLDARRFATLVAQARKHAEAEGMDQAAEAYADALALWRGPVLADLVLESHARINAERLAELRLEGLAEWIECELARGRHGRVIAELESLTAEHPMHERFWSQLMLALYRGGRQSEALGAYHAARRALLEVGLAPGSELRRLESRILNQDVALDGAPAARAPTVRQRPPPAVRPRRRLLAGAAAVVVIGVATAGGISLTRSPSPAALGTISPDSIGIVDPGRNALTDEISLQARPAALAYGAGSLWVATRGAQTLLRVDPRTQEVTTTSELGAEPTAIAIGGGFVWVLCGPARLLFQFDAETGDLVRKRSVEGRLPAHPDKGLALPPLGVEQTEPYDLAAGGDAAWLGYANSVGRVDAETGALQHIWLRAGALSFSNRAGALWVVGPYDIVRIDAGTKRVTQRIPLPPVGSYNGMSGVASAAEAVWVTQHTTAWMIDPTIGRVVAVIPLGHEPIDITVDERTVWTANDDGTVSRIDTRDATVVRTIPLGDYPRSAYPVQLATGHGAVWIGVH